MAKDPIRDQGVSLKKLNDEYLKGLPDKASRDKAIEDNNLPWKIDHCPYAVGTDARESWLKGFGASDDDIAAWEAENLPEDGQPQSQSLPGQAPPKSTDAPTPPQPPATPPGANNPGDQAENAVTG